MFKLYCFARDQEPQRYTVRQNSLCIFHNLWSKDTTQEAYCYLWDESKADHSANIFASFLNYFVSKIPFEPRDEIIFYSNGYIYQNRNVVVANTLLHNAMKNNITIIRKFLEKGHTQMECDTCHSAIETNLPHTEMSQRGLISHLKLSISITIFSQISLVWITTHPFDQEKKQVTHALLMDGVFTYKLLPDREWEEIPKLSPLSVATKTRTRSSTSSVSSKSNKKFRSSI